jgi:hypothetical protein
MKNKIGNKIICIGLVTTMVVVTGLSIPVNANPVPHNLSKVWDHMYGPGTSMANAYSVVKIFENGINIGYILAGVKTIQPANQNVIYCVKTDLNGNLIKEQSISLDNQNYMAYCIKQTVGGGYIITGKRVSDFSILVIRTNENLDVIWYHYYGPGDSFCVQQTIDYGFIISGMKPVAGGRADFKLIKLNAVGTTLWNNSYDISDVDMGFWVEQVNDGGYILAGTSLDFQSYHHQGVLLKVDARGNEMWHQLFGNLINDDVWVWSAKQTTDGGLVLAGSKNGNVWLVKTDSSGAQQWEHSYSPGVAHSIDLSSDGGFIVTGQSPLNDHVYVLKTKNDGTQEAEVTYGTENSVGESVIEATVKNYIVAGINYGSYGFQQMYLLNATLSNTAPGTPLIIGPTTGKVGVPYNYVVNAGDPEGDTVYYNINWDTTSPPSNIWYGPYPSGVPQTFTHTWTQPGTYTIGVKAKDNYNDQGPFGTLTVRITL